MSAAPKSPPMPTARSFLDPKWAAKVDIVEVTAVTPSVKDPKRVIAVCSNHDPESLLDLAIDHGVTQIVQEGALSMETEINASALMLNDRDVFLKYPVSSILDPVNASKSREKELVVLKIDFKQAIEKHGMLQAIADQLKVVCTSQSLVHEILGVADELITNAIFNAPFVDSENLATGAARRDPNIKMDRGKTGRVFVGHDGDRLIIGCHDPYGSLNLMRLFQRVRECYRHGVADSINMGAGGAGIGSYMVYNASSSYYAAVKGGLATLVCCAIPLKLSGKKRALLPKNLHYFHI